MNSLDPSESPPVFVLRGARGPNRMVFLHGLCGHGQGYAQSFQFTAADHGLLVAPQGDVLCGTGPWSTWSGDVSKIDGRISRAFLALGDSGSEEIAVIGYSLGATLALNMARRWPERYTRLILIASPNAPSAAGLRGVRSTVMMAGQLDRKDLMRKGVAAMRAAGIPSTFMALPGARHGEMGSEPERAMREALEWLFQHDRGAETPPQIQ